MSINVTSPATPPRVASWWRCYWQRPRWAWGGWAGTVCGPCIRATERWGQDCSSIRGEEEVSSCSPAGSGHLVHVVTLLLILMLSKPDWFVTILWWHLAGRPSSLWFQMWMRSVGGQQKSSPAIKSWSIWTGQTECLSEWDGEHNYPIFNLYRRPLSSDRHF